MEDRMENTSKPSESGGLGPAIREPGKNGTGTEEPCDKAFNQETARLKDADESCDDGVR
jgi:hypothetical protein